MVSEWCKYGCMFSLHQEIQLHLLRILKKNLAKLRDLLTLLKTHILLEQILFFPS